MQYKSDGVLVILRLIFALIFTTAQAFTLKVSSDILNPPLQRSVGRISVHVLGIYQNWVIVEFEGSEFKIQRDQFFNSINYNDWQKIQRNPLLLDEVVNLLNPVSLNLDNCQNLEIAQSSDQLKLVSRKAWDPNYQIKKIESGEYKNVEFEGTLTSSFDKKGFQNYHYLVLHHSGDNGHTPYAIKEDHKENGWGDIGYHYIIPKNPTSQGEIFEARSLEYQGAHGGSLTGNYHTIGVVLVGNFAPFSWKNPKGSIQAEVPTKFQEETFLKLKRRLGFIYPGMTTKGHKDLRDGETLCPGRNAMYLTE